MKYLILRKRYGATENPFTEMVSAEGGRVLGFPFEADTQDLKEHEVGDLKRDPNVEELVPSIFFKLIAPVEESAAAPATRAAWGPDAVGATRCLQNGDGVTVAVLDTGIDSDHPAFQGLSLDATNLKDFVVDERGEAGSAPDAHGHGTHVAATIFGRDVNGTRIGIARGVKRVLIGKVLGPQGGSTEAIFNAIEWALGQRADVISMSLGTDFPGMVKRLVETGFPVDIASSRARTDRTCAYSIGLPRWSKRALHVGAVLCWWQLPAMKVAGNKTLASPSRWPPRQQPTVSFPLAP